MVAAKANGCRVCPKVFCCAECRDVHERSKHPNKPKCALCVKRPALAFNPVSDKGNEELIDHVLLSHLPLRCQLCGDVYASSQDFALSLPCRWWYSESRRLPETPPQQAGAVPASGANEPGPAKLPLSPLLAAEVEKSLRISDTSSLAHLKQDNNLDSPPTELVRLTSTPVPGVAFCPKQSSASAIPLFVLSKTPSSFDKQRSGSSFGSDSTSGVEVSSVGASRFYTGTSSLLEERQLGKSENRSEAELSCYQSPAASSLKKQQINPMSGEVVTKSSSLRRGNDTMEKRVRFSDQYPAAAASSYTSSHADDSDVFFEARDSFDEDEAAPAKGKACSCCKSKSSEIVSSTTCNKKNAVTNPVDNRAAAVSTTSSSRVFMMLVMEQRDSKTFSTQDLHTLIDSGLKQLGQNLENNPLLANLQVDNCECNNNNINMNPGCVKYSTEVSNFSTKVDTETTLSKEHVSQRTLIRDRCLNVTDRIECYEAAGAREQQTQPDEAAGSSDSGGGIFSAMARVVRCALNKLPVQSINQAITYTMPSPLASLVSTTTTTATAAAAKNLSREPMSQSSLAVPSPVPPISSPILARYCTSLASPRLPLPRAITLKRSRDSGDELAFSTPRERDSPGSSSSSGSQSEGMLSPSLKRYRGRYKIKARQPIARMRQQQILASPRGASRETQRFQQGSLTVGDTLLPLPARAHQYVKTDSKEGQ